MNNQRVLRLGMGWIRLGLLMIGLVIGLGGDLLAQGTAQTIRGKVLDESGDPPTYGLRPSRWDEGGSHDQQQG